MDHVGNSYAILAMQMRIFHCFAKNSAIRPGYTARCSQPMKTLNYTLACNDNRLRTECNDNRLRTECPKTFLTTAFVNSVFGIKATIGFVLT